jgi:hypothetical protein
MKKRGVKVTTTILIIISTSIIGTQLGITLTPNAASAVRYKIAHFGHIARSWTEDRGENILVLLWK